MSFAPACTIETSQSQWFSMKEQVPSCSQGCASLCQRRFLQEDSWRLKMSKVSHYDNVWSLSLRIHGTGIKFTYMNGWLFMVHVGKYASPMDPMGMSTKELGSLNSSHYCNTNFLVLSMCLSDKSGWKHSQPGAMPRFQPGFKLIIEQWKKSWLFSLYRGWYYPILWGF